MTAGTFLFGGLLLWPEMGRGNPTGSITVAAMLVVVIGFLGIAALLAGALLMFFEKTRSLGRVLCAAGVGFLGAVFVAIKLD